jgi:hypothetical protein
MTEPISIDRKMDELREAIAAQLRSTGGATTKVSDIRVSLEEWRKLARAAARQLGRPVETLATETRAWASLTDWPSNPEERDVHEAAMRRAINSVKLPSLGGAQSAEQGDIADDDPDVVDGMAKLELLRQMEDIERLRE